MDLGRARQRFQYDLSIHDTPLTRALETGDYVTAVMLIFNSSTDPGVLDAGSYERFPLFIVLCGYDNQEKAKTPNLQIAKFLLEHGAEANKRGTVYHFMEAYAHSKSPMELLVNLIGNVQREHRYSDPITPIIGLDGFMKTNYNDIRHHLLQLMQIFIAHGGCLSFRPSFLGLTHLVDILWTLPDPDLLRLLCEAGVDVNNIDVHGRTALHVLCQADYPPEYKQMRYQAVQYLLKFSTVQASKLSCKQQSAVWHCLKHGAFDLASQLLTFEEGLDKLPGAKVFLNVEPEECDPEVLLATRIPLILVPFVADRDITLRADTHFYDSAIVQERTVEGPIATLVDQGFFCNSKTEASIVNVFHWHRAFHQHKTMLANLTSISHLVPFLFGRSSSKLKILCARKVFNSCLIPHRMTPEKEEEYLSIEKDFCGMYATFVLPRQSNTWCNSESDCVSSTSDTPHSIRLAGGVSKSIFHVDVTDLALLLESLKLPLSMLNSLEFELYRRKLFVLLLHSDSDRLNCTCLEEEQLRLDEMDSDESSTDDDSALEDEGQQQENVSLVSVNFLR